MAGKVWNLSPWGGPSRVKPLVHTYYSPFYQRWINRSWPSGQGADSPMRALGRETFKKAVQGIKRVCVEDRIAATALAENTPYLDRDLLYKAATGTLLQFTDDTGRLWMSVRIAIQQIQPMLDSISNAKGAMLVRNGSYWDLIAPPAGDSVLGFDSGTTQPQWLTYGDAVASLLATLPGAHGDILYRGPDSWVAFPAGTPGYFLQSLGAGADPQWTDIPPPGPSPGDDVIAAWTAVPALPGFDPNFLGTGHTLSVDQKTLTFTSGSPYNYFYGTTARYAGKWYLETKFASSSFAAIGFSGVQSRYIDNGNGSPGNFGTKLRGQVGWQPGGAVQTGGGISDGQVTTISTIQGWIANDDLCMALDIDAMKLWFRTNAGNWNNSSSANPATGVGGLAANWLFAGAATTMVVPGGNLGSASNIVMRQKAADFARAVPSGFSPWSGL